MIYCRYEYNPPANNSTIPSYGIALGEYHGEYTLPDASKRPPDVGFLRIECVLDMFTLAGIIGMGDEDAAEHHMMELHARLPEEIRNATGEHGFGFVYDVYGDLPALEWAFREYIKTLFANGGPSGDDDVFDYWPAGMQMGRDFAASLDAVKGEGTPYTNELHDAYVAFVCEGGRISEYAWDSNDESFEDAHDERD